jgi:D-beta-D-heptose 7-phosphate kinase / D-beta-D-heptose 1-phosphate adenosyltransferase
MTRRNCVVVLGDALLDRDLEGTVERVSPEGPVPVVNEPAQRVRAGGAGLAAALAGADGRDVTLVTALARDAAGGELRDALARAGVDVVDLGLHGCTPEKVRVRSHGQTIVRLDHGGPPGTVGAMKPAARAALAGAGALLVSDYGRGITARADVRAAIGALPADVPVIWDPHPKGPPPVPGALLVTPNRSEAAAAAGSDAAGAHDLGELERIARVLLERWQAVNVCVTMAADGALLLAAPGPPMIVPAPRIAGGDASGAGDRFASLVTGMLAEGALVSEAVSAAVAPASDFVSSGGAAMPGAVANARPARPRNAAALAARVRARGGRVIATGGCFDLLHAGHVGMLQAARGLGDCLIVCLNSDTSVARLKGPGRPIVAEADRVAVLAALGCVDAVAVFDEDTPDAVLEQLRPHVWAKGGDYAMGDLPEARALARWDGRAVILPYIAGRSTTRMIEEAAGAGH